MDPQLAQLILTALQSDSDLSGLTGAVKNPLMQYLSGSYNPMAGMQETNSELFSTYAGNPEYPGVNAIIDLIQSGADKFQVRTAAKSADNRDIFDSTTFDQLAGQLWDDYNENRAGGANDFWAKNNLSRPEDVYSENNLPSKAGLLNYLRDYQSKETNLLTEAGKARARADESKKKLGPAFGKNIKTGGFIDFLKNDPEGYAMAQKAGVSPGFITPDGKTNKQLTVRELVGDKAGNMSTQQMINFLKNNEQGKKILKQRGIRSDAITKSGMIRYAKANVSDLFSTDTRAQSKPRERDEYYARDFAAKQLEDEAKMQQYIKKQFVEGYLDRAQERGVTPLNDQLRQMSQFIQKPQ